MYLTKIFSDAYSWAYPAPPVKLALSAAEEAAKKTEAVVNGLISIQTAVVAAELPSSTLSQLYEIQQNHLSELKRMLNKPERLGRWGQWEKAQDLYNDLLLINRQIDLLTKAKKEHLSEDEKATVGNPERRLNIVVKMAAHRAKFDVLAQQENKNLSIEPSNLSDEEVLKLLETKEYKAALINYLKAAARNFTITCLSGIAIYGSCKLGLLSSLATFYSPELGGALTIPENLLKNSPGLFAAAPFIVAPVSPLDSQTRAQIYKTLTAPARNLAEEIYNLKDAAADSLQFVKDSGQSLYHRGIQTAAIASVSTVSVLALRALASTKFVSTGCGYLAWEVGSLASLAEDATVSLTAGMDPLTAAGMTTIGTLSLAGSTLLNTTETKSPSMVHVGYSIPKAGRFLQNSAAITAVFTACIGGLIYASSSISSDPSLIQMGMNLAADGAFGIAKRATLTALGIAAIQYNPISNYSSIISYLPSKDTLAKALPMAFKKPATAVSSSSIAV